MLLPISLLWLHIIILILVYLAGKTISKLIEPIPIDNILKEVHNRNFLITSTISTILINFIAIVVLQTNYIPTPQIVKLLSTSIENTIATRIIYLLLHSISFLLLQPTIKFIITPEYKYRFLSKVTFAIILLGIIHAVIFFCIIVYVVLTT